MHFLNLPLREFSNELGTWCGERGEPRFRQQQIREFLLEKRTQDPRRMGNLPASLRSALGEGPLAAQLQQELLLTSTDGTRKFRFALARGGAIESVWIPAPDRATLCVSSQAGCPARCSFCATGAGGFRRDLSPSEILEQWLHVDRVARDDGWPPHRVTQIVFMGMGEPLLNYEALEQSLEWLTSAEGFQFSPRRVTVSTVGVVPRMAQLAERFPQVRLALSLHSAVDSTREQIVPMNRKYDVAALRGVLQKISQTSSSRRVTLEYVHLAGVNDSVQEAMALAHFAADTQAHVNVLPFHPFPGAPYRASNPAELEQFCSSVRLHFDGRVTLRKSRGLDIAGACGQLALPGGAKAWTPGAADAV